MFLGICDSPRKSDISGTYKFTKTVLENRGRNFKLVSLRDKKIFGCKAYLMCVEDNVCKVKDDFEALRDKIVRADAYVIGQPVYYSGIYALIHAILEQWFQFRYRECDFLWGKIGVVVGVDGMLGK